MSSSSEVVRDDSRARFNLILSRSSEPVEPTPEDEEDAELLVPRKRRRAITDAERKTLRDWYFDPGNGKPAHKYIREWFL